MDSKVPGRFIRLLRGIVQIAVILLPLALVVGLYWDSRVRAPKVYDYAQQFDPMCRDLGLLFVHFIFGYGILMGVMLFVFVGLAVVWRTTRWHWKIVSIALTLLAAFVMWQSQQKLRLAQRAGIDAGIRRLDLSQIHQAATELYERVRTSATDPRSVQASFARPDEGGSMTEWSKLPPYLQSLRPHYVFVESDGVMVFMRSVHASREGVFIPASSVEDISDYSQQNRMPILQERPPVLRIQYTD